MKEATGELNMTVITVVAIAAVAALFYAFVWPSIQRSIVASTACSQGAGTVIGNLSNEGDVSCERADAQTGEYKCTFYHDGKTEETLCTQK